MMENIENTLGFHGELMHSFKILRGSHLIAIDRCSGKYLNIFSELNYLLLLVEEFIFSKFAAILDYNFTKKRNRLLNFSNVSVCSFVF